MSVSNDSTVSVPRKAVRWRKRALRLCGSAVFLLLLLEVGARVFWWSQYDVSPLHPGRVVYQLYKTLEPVETAPVAQDDGVLNILLLGGSVMRRAHDSGAIYKGLNKFYKGRFRIFHLAEPGHTTLDTLYKMRRVRDKSFDLVIVYHGINDVRANNCPDAVYQPDYTHVTQYRMARQVMDGGSPDFLLPVMGQYLWSHFVLEPRGQAIPQLHMKAWLKHGATIKTTDAFRNNLRATVDLAREQGAKVVLMSFAYYVPTDYTHERYKAGALDYTADKYSYPVELWGQPANVIKALDAHNGVIRQVARERETYFVDQTALIDAAGKNFTDICHFTAAAMEQFTDNLFSATGEEPLLEIAKGAPDS